MTFSEFAATLSRELGIALEIEGDVCAVRASAPDGSSVTAVLQSFAERDAVLATADLGAPPPERLEKLYRSLLEANDLFRDTAGAMLSLNPDTGHVRLQRFDSLDAIAEAGPGKALLAFLEVAGAWSAVIRDYRDAPDAAPDAGNAAAGASGLRV